MVGYNNKISPYYMPRTSVEEVDGKSVLVIWCPAGINRLYSVPEETLLLYTNIRNSWLSKSVLRKKLLLGRSKTAYGYAKGCF